MHRLLFLITLIIFLIGLPLAVPADEADFLPGTVYDPDAPRFEQVLGHAAGERISAPNEVRRWFNALAAAYPDRIRLVPYAKSWQGRELFFAVIGNPERVASLDAIRADIQTLARPDRNSEAAVTAALERVPGTVWIAASVHGNEISPADGAMVTAWHLLAARDNELVKQILDTTLVFINPMQNPDGRARFVHHFESAEGLEPRPSRLAAEHDERWPSGRVNHYLFDLNRDWLALTQPETRGQVRALLRWYPLAFVDAHEMGGDQTFFFAPEAVPYNPLLEPAQRASLALFGANNARWFERFGLQYFTREVYDAFYPGYGASWPSYYGGVAMTYEQGSARGLVLRKRNGEEFTYADTVQEYFIAMLATIETVATHRERLWRDFVDYRRSAVGAAATEGPRAWVIPAQRDQGGTDRLGALLARHGAEVYRSGQALQACGGGLGAGSYVIPAAQPEYRKLRVLLDPEVEMDPDFIAEQERRRAKDLADEIYDVTAWSLPVMFNLDLRRCDQRVATQGMTRVTPDDQPAPPVANADAGLAFLAPGGSNATARLLARALRQGLRVQSNDQPFTLGERRYPSGTLIFPVADNPDDLARRLTALAERTGAELIGVDSGWVTSGPNFGSAKVATLTAPRVALAWDTPTDVYSPGATRFVIERQLGYPVTPIRVATLAGADLNRFDVVILPDQSRWRGGYAQGLGKRGRDNLAEWVENGGVLVTFAGATEWAAHPDVDLLAARAEYLVNDLDTDQTGNAEDDERPRVAGTLIESEADLHAQTTPERENPDSVAGVLVRAAVDADHWLAAGVADTVNVLIRGDRIFQPLDRDRGATVARFAGVDSLVAAGHLWQENREQLAYKPFVMVQPRQRGMVIAFTEDPAVRAYLDGLNQILANAVLRAPAYSDKLR